jgi:hypothetical protein
MAARRTKSIKAVDPDKFLRAYQAVVLKGDKPIAESNGIGVVDDDGSVQNLKIKDHPMTRAVYAVAQALPNDDLHEHSAIMMRLQALLQITRYPAVQEFIHHRNTAIHINNNLIRGAAVCHLKTTFFPSRLLRAVRSLSEPTPFPGS